ncbi:MAG: hypothetical protein F6K35_36165 [Okeania sp. SIO2H7]|nr:hypothetical protein [Okeania sp. SIO2H7]
MQRRWFKAVRSSLILISPPRCGQYFYLWSIDATRSKRAIAEFNISAVGWGRGGASYI